MEKTIAILVISFDGYSDLWPIFFKCKKLFWQDCPYKTYLITNHLFTNDECIVIQTGDETNWCDRVQTALEVIKESTLIVLLEDYLIGDYINSSRLSECILHFIKTDANYLRLIDIPRKHHKTKELIYPVLEDEEYGINLQPAIWKKSFFTSILEEVKEERSAWGFEIHLLKKCTENHNQIVGCFGTTENILNIHNGVLKGKWFPKEVAYFEKKGIRIDDSLRGVLSRKEYRRHLVRRIIRETLSPSMRKKLKKALMRMHVKFVSNI